MPEIGLFGSEGGAPTHGVPTLSVSKASRLTEKSVPLYLPWRFNTGKASRDGLPTVSKASRLTE